MELQENKGKEMCNGIVTFNLSKTATLKKLKPLNFTGGAKNLIVEMHVPIKINEMNQTLQSTNLIIQSLLCAKGIFLL